MGNPDRGDDAAGRLVAQGLRTTLPPTITVLEQSGDAADLVHILADYDTVIVADAVQTRVAEPGHLHRIDARAGPLPATFREVSTHGFGVAEAIELARALGQLPRTVVIYGIEADDFTPGREPSAAVAAGVERAIRAIVDELGAGTG
jgi:hydrogenase maturation protease